MPGFISKKSLLYITFAIVMYVMFLLVTIPASMVVKNFVPANVASLVKYNNVSGTIWNGTANQVTIRQIPVGKLSWDMSVLPLLWGNVDLRLNAKREDALLISDTSLSQGDIKLQDTRIEFPVADLMPLIYGFPISLDGNINAYFKNIELVRESLFVIEGRAVLSEINLIAPQALSLGNLVAEFEKQENGTRVTINDQTGPVQVEAIITLAETGFYTVNATLTPRNSADITIKSTLAMLGKKDSQGRYLVTTRGRLPLKF